MSQLNTTARLSPLIESSVLDFFMTFNLLFLSELIGIVGIVANVVNIRVFYKLGFHESVDITLTALAISDMGALITIQFTNVMVNPWCLAADLPFVPIDVLTLVSFYPHNYFIRLSGFITSFAAFERCLSVMVPLKVKTIITRRTSLVVNLAMFTITTLNVFSPYYFSYLEWTFVPELNQTLLALSTRGDWDAGLSVSYLITDLFVPYFTFFILIACNVMISTKLTSKMAWRKSLSRYKKTARPEKISGKEAKLVRMLTVVSVIFIVCLIPQSAILTAVAFVSELGLNAAYFDIAFLCYCFSYLSESICSSINIVVYYRMSSKYRQTFQTLFCKIRI